MIQRMRSLNHDQPLSYFVERVATLFRRDIFSRNMMVLFKNSKPFFTGTTIVVSSIENASIHVYLRSISRLQHFRLLATWVGELDRGRWR